MSLADDLRRRTLSLIQADPVSVTIHRWVHTARPAGGVKLDETVLQPQTVRLYPKRAMGTAVAAPRTVAQPHTWSLIAYPTTDVMAGDEFQALGRRFKVLAVVDQTFRGEVVSRTADLEEVREDAGQ